MSLRVRCSFIDCCLCIVNNETATSLELPLDTDQATKFLDEHDLHDVLNKMPDEAFDLLTGMFTEANWLL